jgi:hypothetical protein
MATKKKVTRKSNPPAEPTVSQYREKKCVRITEADNGYSVSTYGRGGEKIMIAKSEAEAIRHTKELLKGK